MQKAEKSNQNALLEESIARPSVEAITDELDANSAKAENKYMNQSV